jgi:hypothetical protein
MLRPAPVFYYDAIPQLANRSDEIVARIAGQPEELLAAFRLTYDAYVQAGLAWPNPQRLRVTPYQLETGSEVFLATRDDEVLITVSLVSDGRLGLPMESVYPQEVEMMRGTREKPFRVAEVSCLAMAETSRSLRRPIPILREVFRLLLHYARHRAIDWLLIAVHPKHAAFYERVIGFRRMGTVRRYAAVLDRPAVALSLDLRRTHVDDRPNYAECLYDGFPPERLVRPVARCQKFVERMRYFAAQQQRWEHEARFTAQPLPEYSVPKPQIVAVPA